MSASINDEFLFTNTSSLLNTSVVFHQAESTLSYLLSYIGKIQSDTFIPIKAKKKNNVVFATFVLTLLETEKPDGVIFEN